jgi:uncharacterized protein
MERDNVIAILSSHDDELRNRFGVKSLALFGSVARGEATERSDVDLLVEFSRPTGYFGLGQLQEHLERLLGCSVDLGTPRSLKPRLRDRVLQECIHVA